MIEDNRFQSFVDNAINVARQKTLANSDQLTLGEMILKLKPIVNNQMIRIKEGKNEATVNYDFEYLFPTSIDSWRGAYKELALNFTNYSNESKPMKVSEFLNLLESTIGKTFIGYKGGEFIMNKHTPIWVANYGNSENTAIVEILDKGYEVILITKYTEY